MFDKGHEQYALIHQTQWSKAMQTSPHGIDGLIRRMIVIRDHIEERSFTSLSRGARRSRSAVSDS